MADVAYDVRYFKAIADFCPFPLWALDASGRVQYANRAAAALGSPPIDGHWKGCWPEDAHISAERAILRASGGEQTTFRACASSPGQRRLYLEATVTPIVDAVGAVHEIIAVARDATEAVETHGFLNSVVQLLPLALTVQDLSSEQCILANPAAEDLFGAPLDRFSGAMASDIWSQAMMGLEDGAHTSAEACGPTRTMWDAPPTHDQPHGRRVMTTHVTTFDDDGPRHMIALSEDITEQARREEALAQARDEAELGRRAQTALLANVSHEIRTPLNGLLAASDLLRAHELGDSAAELVGIIGASSRALDRRLQDLLDAADLGRGRVTLNASIFHPAELVCEAVAAMTVAAQAKGLKIRAEIGLDATLKVSGDPLRLRRVLDQLIDNAIKFTDQGKISVAVHTVAGEHLRFRVVDTGRGFDRETKAYLFRSFHQEEAGLARGKGGCGLGLALAADLVRLMGGDIDCDLTPDGGAIFWVDLPLPLATAAEAPSAPQRSLRILLADDHPVNRRVVELILGDTARITAVEDGLAAVEAFRRGNFDLVLMDIQMPRLDGISAVAQIRCWEAAAGQSPTPIAMLSANIDDEHLQASRAAGADSHIAKPFTAAVLAHSVAELVQRGSPALAMEPVRQRT